VKSYRFIIKGKVQGVFYRKSVAEKLNNLKVDGYVRNLPDKSVEVVVNIDESMIEKIIEILKEGSIYSDVKSIYKEEIKPIKINGFSIKY